MKPTRANIQVDGGGGYALVAQENLDISDVRPLLDQPRRKCVAQEVGVKSIESSGLPQLGNNVVDPSRR